MGLFRKRKSRATRRAEAKALKARAKLEAKLAAKTETKRIKAAERASELTEQMLTYSGKGHFPMKPIDLSTVVKATAHVIRLSLSHGARIHLELSPKPVTIVADFKQIGQVISNLITNADEAMEDKDGIIRVTTGTAHYTREYLDSIYLGEDLSPGKCAYLEISSNTI